jgi:hypothetical protein
MALVSTNKQPETVREAISTTIITTAMLAPALANTISDGLTLTRNVIGLMNDEIEAMRVETKVSSIIEDSK